MGTNILLALLVSAHLYAAEKNYTLTDMVQLRFVDINQLDFDYLENRYGFSIEYCILDGLCVFKNTKNLTQEQIKMIEKEEKNIRFIRVHRKYKMKPY